MSESRPKDQFPRVTTEGCTVSARNERNKRRVLSKREQRKYERHEAAAQNLMGSVFR